MLVLGIEYIGDEIRAGIVDTQKGTLQSAEFVSFPILEHTPSKLMSRIHEIVRLFNWTGLVGVGFPGPVKQGIILEPPFLDSIWEVTDLQLMLKELTDLDVYVFNGTDASAWAEMTYGAGKESTGTSIVVTIGPIISTSLFIDKHLVPNTDLGLIEVNGVVASISASNKARKEEGLKRKTWAKRVQTILSHYEEILNPDLFILCGEICHKADKVIPFIEVKTEVREAALFKHAGMIGTACFASQAVRFESN